VTDSELLDERALRSVLPRAGGLIINPERAASIKSFSPAKTKSQHGLCQEKTVPAKTLVAQRKHAKLLSVNLSRKLSSCLLCAFAPLREILSSCLLYCIPRILYESIAQVRRNPI
jgi:hypothetical protein